MCFSRTGGRAQITMILVHGAMGGNIWCALLAKKVDDYLRLERFSHRSSLPDLDSRATTSKVSGIMPSLLQIKTGFDGSGESEPRRQRASE